MASVNPLSRELVFKIVYYGPGLGGKTTTLEYLHATAKPEHRGKLVSLATPVDRTLYFDFLPVRLPPVRGMNIRLQLFTVPGQVYFNATRKLVLTGADGIVFVSDSQIVRADANLESLENLRENLAEQGRELSQVPLIFQHNKRDLPDLLPLEELDEMLNPFDAISLPTSAKTGLNIYEALEAISSRVIRTFEARLPEVMDIGFDTRFDAVEGGLVTALRDASPSPQRDVMVSRLTPPGSPWSSMPPDATLGDPLSSDFPPEDDRADGSELLPPEDDLARSEPPDEDAAATLQNTEGRALRVPPLPAAPSEHPGPPPLPPLPPPLPLSPEGEDAAPGAAVRPGISFAVLWSKAEREIVTEVEAAIAGGRYAYAIERCDALVCRLLASAADLFSSSQMPRDPAVVPLLLGLDGRRYLGFRSAVLKARSGGDVTVREALAAFAFAIDARLAESAI